VKKWGKELLGMNPIPFSTMNMTPDAVKPFVEIFTNQKFFTGRDLITDKQQKLSNYMQETADTSVISKLAARKLFWASGELVNVSPIHLDHVVKGYFAGIGKYGLDAVDAGLAAFELVDVPAPPAESPLQLVGVKGFFKQPYEQTRNQEDFFSAYTWVEKMLASTTHDAISSDQKYFDKYGGRALYYVRPRVEGGRRVITEIRRIKTAIGDFRQVQQMIATDPNLSPEEKKRQIALNRESIDDLAKTGLELFLKEDLKRTK
jgi:hypothetical protein